MKITLAFAHDGEAAWLQSAYDEYTADEHGGIPDFHTDSLKTLGNGVEVREVIVELDYQKIEDLFNPVVLEAKVVES